MIDEPEPHISMSTEPGNPEFFGRLRTAFRSPITWLVIIISYVLYSRMWDLAEKVMHHDESLFAYYGYWLYRGNGYDYQPILHGPVLQFVSAFFFFLFGDDQWTMRLPSLLGGLLMFPVVWHWRRYLGGTAGAIAVTGVIALSPSIAYYTRFLRNDVGYLTATMACAYFLMRAMQTAAPRFVWGAMMMATLMFCMMESSIFFFAACVGYLTTMVLVDLFVWRRARPATGRADDTAPQSRSTWPAWLRDDDNRWQVRWPAGRSSLRGIDFLLCLPVAAAITFAAGYLFYRVLYGSIHIYKPLVAFANSDSFTLTPTRANWVIAAATFVGVYVLSLLVLANIRRPRGRYGFLGWFSRVVWLNIWHVIAAIAAAVIIYTTLFTTFFTHTIAPSFDHQVRDFRGPDMHLTPLQIYKNTWDYWWDQHKLHRIKGPFHYYLPILFLYELPIIGLAILGWIRSLRSTRRPAMHLAILAAMHLLLAVIIWILPPIDWAMMDKNFHVTHPIHLFLVLLYAQLLVYVAPLLFLQGRRVESFITYWGITNLFAYSYAGEKVPWLTIHTTGPMALLAACELVRLARRWFQLTVKSPALSVEPAYKAGTTGRRVFLALAILAIVYQVRNNHLLLLQHPWSPAERLVYNHTSPDIHKTMEVVEDLAAKTNFGPRLPILIQGEMGWPLHWYLRDYTNISAPVGETAENTTRPLVMVDWHLAGLPNLKQNYTIQRMKVREWWEPQMLNISAMTDIFLKLTPGDAYKSGPMADRYQMAIGEWRKLWHYLAYREIWIDESNPSWSNGTNEFALCVRKDLGNHLLTYEWLAATPKRIDVPVFMPY